MKCRKCEGTGFAYGDIPCECVGDLPSVRDQLFNLTNTGRGLKQMVDSIERLSIAIQDFTMEYIVFEIRYNKIVFTSRILDVLDDKALIIDAVTGAGFTINMVDHNLYSDVIDVSASKAMK